MSFLTVHMADALMKIVNLIPVQVRATGYSQKLPSLRPIAVNGYDLVDTEIQFETGALAHIITGWALPNTAESITVQSSRIICSDGLIDLGLDTPGLREVHADGIMEVNPLFRNFEKDKSVTGYGISSPGRLYQQILALQNGKLSDAERAAAFHPMTLGFYTTLVLEGAEKSLAEGRKLAGGVTLGQAVDLRQLVIDQLGAGPSTRVRPRLSHLFAREFMSQPAAAATYPGTQYPPGFRARRGLNWGFLGLLYTCFYMCRYNFSIANKSISDGVWFQPGGDGLHHHRPRCLPTPAGMIINGLLTDRMGGKRAMLIGAAGTIVMNMLFGAASFAGMLGLFIAIRGCGRLLAGIRRARHGEDQHRLVQPPRARTLLRHLRLHDQPRPPGHLHARAGTVGRVQRSSA